MACIFFSFCSNLTRCKPFIYPNIGRKSIGKHLHHRRQAEIEGAFGIFLIVAELVIDTFDPPLDGVEEIHPVLLICYSTGCPHYFAPSFHPRKFLSQLRRIWTRWNTDPVRCVTCMELRKVDCLKSNDVFIP